VDSERSEDEDRDGKEVGSKEAEVEVGPFQKLTGPRVSEAVRFASDTKFGKRLSNSEERGISFSESSSTFFIWKGSNWEVESVGVEDVDSCNDEDNDKEDIDEEEAFKKEEEENELLFTVEGGPDKIRAKEGGERGGWEEKDLFSVDDKEEDEEEFTGVSSVSCVNNSFLFWFFLDFFLNKFENLDSELLETIEGTDGDWEEDFAIKLFKLVNDIFTGFVVAVVVAVGTNTVRVFKLVLFFLFFEEFCVKSLWNDEERRPGWFDGEVKSGLDVYSCSDSDVINGGGDNGILSSERFSRLLSINPGILLLLYIFLSTFISFFNFLRESLLNFE